ncbi:MAG: shikimate dehydrogenase [Aestuariivirga sp.]|uniref:shikimate dehydrogenase n=1 Tax=Aestuariivirga sp. TaxID=2650926 RepID=UPI0038D114CB
MIKACVIGWPISHSRSPLIHGYWLKKHGIDGSYTRQPVEPAALNAFISDLEDAGYSGCNVTLPHKEKVFQLIVPADETTARLGAVNTVFRRAGKTYGTNTDGEGFVGSLHQSLPGIDLNNARVVVLGAGGAALAVVSALLDQGVAEVAIANRTEEKARELRTRFGQRIKPVAWNAAADHLAESRLLVNTTSLGMKGQAPLDLDLSRLDIDAVVADIVYTPLQTPLLAQAVERGNPIVEGLGMLLHQAVRGFSLWFGVTPEVTGELYDLIARDIDPDYRR